MGSCVHKSKDKDEGPSTDRQQQKQCSAGDDTIDLSPGRYARGWLEMLPMPLPATLGMLYGALCVTIVGSLRRFLMLTLVFFGIAPVLYSYVMKLLAKKVKEELEKQDQDYLGVDLHLGRLDLSICSARFVINDFIMDNPDGYKSGYLMKCRRIVLDIDMLEALKSKGKKIIIEEFTLDNVDVIMEYDGLIVGTGKTNVSTVMDFISNRKSPSDEKDGEKKPEVKASEKKDSAKPEETDGKKPGREYIIEKVSILDVGAKIQSKIGLGPRMALADMRYSHFSNQNKARTMGENVGLIFKTLSKSLLASVAGKGLADKAL